jgi:hypothetical protein
MNCQQVRFQIIETLDNEPASVQIAKVRQHLESCPGCSTFYAEQDSLTQLLQVHLPQIQPPDRIWRQIEDRITVDAGRGWEFRLQAFVDFCRMPQLKPVVAAIAIVLTCSALLLSLNESGVEPEMLAKLEAYTLEVQDNPFLPDGKEFNPFFTIDSGLSGNPFEQMGSQR